MGGWARVGIIAAVGLASIACADSRTTSTTVAVDMPARPSAEQCDPEIRQAISTAVAVRATWNLPDVPATGAAAQTAADAPDSTWADYGVPLLPSERSSLADRRISPDPVGLLAAWVNTHSDSFGAIVDGSGGVVVNVDTSDERLLQTTRCFESGSLVGSVRYIRSALSTKELDALLAQVVRDRDLLLRDGITMTATWTDGATGTVVIGVAEVTPAIVAKVRARYGPFVRVQQSGSFSGD